MDEADELLMECLCQGCLDIDDLTIDNMCMSCYEHTCDYLEKKGYLIKINDRIYKLYKLEGG